MKAKRKCVSCGVEHTWVNSPICGRCRRQGSKRKCPIEGCDRMIDPRAGSCLWHRHLQQKPVFETCQECGQKMDESRVPVCKLCRTSVMVLCACGCGRYRRKYNLDGLVVEYISGHNDNWTVRRTRPIVRPCLMCGKPFKPERARQNLCSTECAGKWRAVNTPQRTKRVTMYCDVCGKPVLRRPGDVREGQSIACSRECQTRLVADKLRDQRVTDAKRLARQRDNSQCRVCGFDTLVEVHHITPRHQGGPDTLDNLITLCPNHHTMADRGLITQDDLRGYISGTTTTLRPRDAQLGRGG